MTTITTTAPTSTANPAIFQRTVTHSQDQVTEKAAKTGRHFEAMVMSEMLAPMFKGLSTNGPFGGGSGESAYRTFLVQELGKSVAIHGGGTGLGKAVMNSLLSLQETNDGRTKAT